MPRFLKIFLPGKDWSTKISQWNGHSPDELTLQMPLSKCFCNLRSRRLEVVGTRKKQAREKGTRVSPSRAPALSFTHYFQAPVTQASAFGNVELLGNAALHDNCLLIYVVCRVL